MSPSPPFLLVDRYDVTEEIGRGGHAVVYRAVDRVLGREVAVKLLRDDALSRDTLARFLQEVRVTAQLEHAHILHVYDTGSYEGHPYIVMELALGRTLADRLEREGQLPIADALLIIRDIGLALAHAHARGVVHRDVKPENILLGTAGAILADFGIARVTSNDIAHKLTDTGMAVGTLLYMSPEQLCAEPHIDGRSDQYSLACMLYEMLAGVRPHIAATPEGLRLLRMTNRHLPVSAHRPAVAEYVSQALQTALQSMAADRFRTVEDFLTALGLSTSSEYSVSVSGAMPVADTRRSGTPIALSWSASSVSSARWTRARVVLLACIATAAVAGITYFANSTDSKTTRISASKTEMLAVSLSASGDTSARAGRLQQALRSELLAWPAIRLTSGGARAQIGLQIASSLEALGDSSRLLLEVRDADSLGTRHYELIAPTSRFDSASAVAGAVAALVRQALGGVSSQVAPGVEMLPDRSLSALHSYVDGFTLLRSGELAQAAERFRTARDSSPRFALAGFWAAQSGAWATPNDVAAWRGDIDAAVRANALRGTDSLLAAALQQHAAMDFVPACAAYRSATVSDPASFVAWYGLGTCLRLDSAVIRTPAGLRFRSSHWEALKAYQRAVDLAPSSEWLAALFGPVLRTTYAQNGRMRAGLNADNLAVEYRALPALVADTLAFFPLPKAAVLSSAPGSVPTEWLGALRRARATLMDISSRWVTRFPSSADAWMERATSLEISGRIERGSSSPSADDALDRVLDTKASSALRSRVAVARARLAVRRSEIDEALKTSQIAIRNAVVLPKREQSIIAALAAFAGDTVHATQFSRNLIEEYESLPLVLADLLHSLESAAVQGACENISEQFALVESHFRNTFAPAELDSLRGRWLRRAYRSAVPCLGVKSNGGFSPEIPLDFIYAALARGDRKTALTIIRDMQVSRAGASLSALSWDYLYAESWALAQAGDTAQARTQLTGALEGLASMSMYTFDLVPQAAGLRRSILLLRDISPTVGTISAAEKKWVQRANALIVTPTKEKFE